MQRKKLGVVAVLLGLATGAAVSCESSDGPQSAAGFCPALQGYVSPCDAPTACEQALARDCASLESIVTQEFATATTECMNALGQPQECLDEATSRSTSSGALESFAQAFCLECGGGAGDCEDEVLGSDDDSQAGRAGRIARVLSGDTLARVQDDCATGDACAAGFPACAEQVLARDVPGETATCLLDAVLDSYDASCDGNTSGITAGSTTADTDDPTNPTDTFPTDPTDPTDPTTDPTDPTDPTGDTDGCDDIGCACDFNEDCAGDLICPQGVCEEAMACEDDPFEPNNGEAQAALLDPVTDDDDTGSQLQSELEAAGDIDWFRYEGDDTAFAIVGPYAQVNVNSLELCIYAECLKGLGQTEVSCPKGATQQPSPGGRPGCCASETTGFEIDLSCNGGALSDESAQIYMSVTGSEPGICQEYSLTYHF